MKNKDELHDVSPCGIYCGACSAFKAKDNPELIKVLVIHGMKESDLPCPGCRAVAGACPHLEGPCENYRCAMDHKVDMCFECEEFPCRKLHPSADRANLLPHNMKLYSQLFIQKHGVKEWKHQYHAMRNRYFSGKISYGKGPLLENEDHNSNEKR